MTTINPAIADVCFDGLRRRLVEQPEAQAVEGVWEYRLHDGLEERLISYSSELE